MTNGFAQDLMTKIRARFVGVEECPIQGSRIFFENAGGALTLKSVIDTSKYYAGIPDNQGRANPGAQALGDTIGQSRDALRVLMNAPQESSGGQFFVGESGTELLFRIISAACLAQPEGSHIIGSTLEHPATRSATARWAGIARQTVTLVPHCVESGGLSVERYSGAITPETGVATLVHASPVTGISVDVAKIAAEIRRIAPQCFIIVDGIQHAAHGQIDLEGYGVDAYVVSPYKMFSRHGYGLAWISDRLSRVPHNCLDGGPEENWEMGTRDTGAYATLIDVCDYWDWLGSQLSPSNDRRERIVAATKAVRHHETMLTDAMMGGTTLQKGLCDLPGVHIVGGVDNPLREGLVSFWSEVREAGEIVQQLNANGIRTHIRRNDHYSANILQPLGIDACVRVSMCHYNTLEEVDHFLKKMSMILQK